MTTTRLSAALRHLGLGAVVVTTSIVASTAVGTAAGATTSAAPAAEVTTAAAPTPSPARVGKPTTMAALGDSITQSTGTGELGKENPKNSWATGTDVNSVRARLGITTGNARNLSANGARMDHADTQVTTGRDGMKVDATTQYVTIEMGGNDLCRDSVAAMTPTATYRTQLRQALTAIRTQAPQALVYVMSVPDIYNLWYIRGAPQNSTYHPEGQSDQASGLNGARFYWDGLTGLGVKFPCQSLLSNPDSYSQADRDRRAAVRARNLEYNAALRAECGLWLRCRYDNDYLFNLTSNRVSPPNGALRPQSQWAFTDSDISRNEGAGRYLCPVQGVVAGGCGDHFHPSKAGQSKLAEAAAVSSYQWSDTTAPTAGTTVAAVANGDGTVRAPATVSFTGTDAAGIRGQEVRVHNPDGTVTAWDPSIGLHSPVTVSTQGTTYVEVRTLDVNGNLSASSIRTLNVRNPVPSAPGTPTATASPGQVSSTWAPPADAGGLPVLRYEVERLDLTDGTSVLTTGTTATQLQVAAANGRASRVRVRAVTAVGAGSWSFRSDVLVAPFARVGDFANRVYQDLTGRDATAAEAEALRTALLASTTPANAVGDVIESGVSVAPIVRLYRSYFLRYPEAEGLAYWEGRYRAGLSVNRMSALFAGTQEFRTLYGSLSNGDFVRRIYLNVLEREPDAEGLAYWIGELDSGRWSRGRVMTFYSESAENRTRTRNVVIPIAAYWGTLRRLPTTTERNDAKVAIEGGGTAGTIITPIYASAEWLDHVT